MKKSAKVLSAACVTVLMLNVLAACSAKTENTTTASPAATKAAEVKVEATKAPDNKPVNLRFSWWGSDPRHKATLDAIALYKTKNANVTIAGEYGGNDGYQQKLMTQLASGTAPDLIQFDYTNNVPLTKGGDNFVDLGKESGIDLSQFSKKVLDQYSTVDGKIIGLPMGINGFGLMINKAFFQKYGLSPDTEWTWDKIIEEGKRIHQQDKEAYLMTSEVGNAAGGLSEFTFSNYLRSKTGKYWLNDDNSVAVSKDELTDAFNLLKQLYDSGAYQPLGDSNLFNGKQEQNPKFVNGQIGMVQDWSGTVAKYKGVIKPENFTTAKPIFAKDGNKNVSFKPSMLLGVNKKSPNAAEAVKFVNWFLDDKDAALILTDQRSVPASEIAKKTIVDANKTDNDVARLVNFALASPASPPPIIASNAEVFAILSDVINTVVYGKSTPDKAADELLKRVQEKLKTLKAN